MSTLASIALALPSVVGLESVTDQVVLYRSDGNPVFSLAFKVGSARARVDHRIEQAGLSRIVDRAASWSKMEDLRRVRELMLKSLLNEGDRLRAFLAAWAALEIMINKIFPHYEEGLFKDFSIPSYVQQVREVMKSRYGLKDKFTVVCGLLNTTAPEADIKDFKNAKGIRDALYHGDALSDDSLPLELVQMLLRKYLELHIAAESITRG